MVTSNQSEKKSTPRGLLERLTHDNTLEVASHDIKRKKKQTWYSFFKISEKKKKVAKNSNRKQQVYIVEKTDRNVCHLEGHPDRVPVSAVVGGHSLSCYWCLRMLSVSAPAFFKQIAG